jgi:hypothetical protein
LKRPILGGWLQEQEDVLTKLRDFWNISNQMHSVRRRAAPPWHRFGLPPGGGASRPPASSASAGAPITFIFLAPRKTAATTSSNMQNITSEMRTDPDVVAVRSGGMPSRIGRTKSGIAPAPSLGCAASVGWTHCNPLRPASFCDAAAAGCFLGCAARWSQLAAT